jgi:hypothetical protein
MACTSCDSATMQIIDLVRFLSAHKWHGEWSEKSQQISQLLTESMSVFMASANSPGSFFPAFNK